MQITLTREKETKGTYRYTEDGPADTPKATGSIYFQKAFLQSIGNPKQIVVTIEPKP
jgi:hypothetical protein